jgi:hypothetical protein
LPFSGGGVAVLGAGVRGMTGRGLGGYRGRLLLIWLLAALSVLASPAEVAQAADGDPDPVQPTVCVTGFNDLGQLYKVDCYDTHAPVPLYCLVPFDTYTDGADRTDRFEIVACPTDPTHTDPPDCLDNESDAFNTFWDQSPTRCVPISTPKQAVTVTFQTPPDSLPYRQQQTLTFTTTDPHGVPVPDVPLQAVTIDLVTDAYRSVPVRTDATGTGSVLVTGFAHRTRVSLLLADLKGYDGAGVEQEFRVRPAVTARTVRSTTGRTAIVGTIRPASSGAAVLQRLRDRRWVRVAVRTVTGTTTARFAHPRAGVYRVCSRVTADYARSCSTVLRILHG